MITKRCAQVTEYCFESFIPLLNSLQTELLVFFLGIKGDCGCATMKLPTIIFLLLVSALTISVVSGGNYSKTIIANEGKHSEMIIRNGGNKTLEKKRKF